MEGYDFCYYSLLDGCKLKVIKMEKSSWIDSHYLIVVFISILKFFCASIGIYW